MTNPQLVGVAVGVAVLVGALVGYVLGLRDAHARWAALGWPMPGRMVHRGWTYWVCAAESPEACIALMEILERDLEWREAQARLERIRRRRP